jgi:hypothetical protein
MTRGMIMALVVTASLSPSLALAQSRPSLQGVWRLVEVRITGPNASTNNKPQPSLYIFTGKHYSIVRVTSADPRPELKDPAKVTEAEALAVWGPLQAQAGTYEIAGGNLFLLPTVAKNPNVMRTGRKPDVFSFTLQGDTLTVVQKSNPDGQPIANPSTFRLTRVE